MNKIKLFFLLLTVVSQFGCTVFDNESVSINFEKHHEQSQLVESNTETPIKNNNNKVVEQYPSNFIIPIKNACLTNQLELLPGAPRPYRSGFHEGIDFYDGFSCTPIVLGTPIYVVDDGVVFRADINFKDPSDALKELVANPNLEKYNSAQKLDIYRGRQIWIEHKYGVITRYAHLSEIAQGVKLGSKVQKGQLIAFVGNSGTPESITLPGTENHLHLEIRQGSNYLGSEMELEKIFKYYSSFFVED